MPTPLIEERAVNTIAYLRLNVYESFSASMSGFLEVAVTYTFQSSLYVRSSGSSAYRRGSCGHLMAILVSYMYRGDGRRDFDVVGEGRREKNFFSVIFFPLPPKLSPFPLADPH